MTKIINFYGGPGTGKSTTAALAYAKLKLAGKNCELVREYVKDWAWDNRKITTYDQIYFLGKQVRRESMLYGKTDIIVTDSPVWLGLYYARHFCPELIADGVELMTKAFYHQAQADGHEHSHVFLTRSKPYQATGRYQTEEEAKEVDIAARLMLDEMSVSYITSSTEEYAIEDLLVRLNLI